MGTADVVPGVSGGTMALIFGIYPRLINAIKSFDSDWIKGLVRFDLEVILHRPHFTFLIPLLVGIFAAILFFTRIIPLPVLIRYPSRNNLRIIFWFNTWIGSGSDEGNRQLDIQGIPVCYRRYRHRTSDL